mmetsp:Transcript_12915/g.42249  ORF Transcript_12915/g.42249 Transcript_12915/m.42249 type:complete len:204 (+) Transcript_12915:94-705(+)
MKARPGTLRAQSGVGWLHRASASASREYGRRSTRISSSMTLESPRAAASYASAAIQLRRMYFGLTELISVRRSVSPAPDERPSAATRAQYRLAHPRHSATCSAGQSSIPPMAAARAAASPSSPPPSPPCAKPPTGSPSASPPPSPADPKCRSHGRSPSARKKMVKSMPCGPALLAISPNKSDQSVTASSSHRTRPSLARQCAS